MLTVVLEIRDLATDDAIKSVILHLSQSEYDELKAVVAEINEQQGLVELDCYQIA